MQKIDFYAGLHGHYLELLINVFINQNNYDISRPIFTKTGACHLKKIDRTYKQIAVAGPYSNFNMPFDSDDQVIKILPNTNDLLIGITNNLLRVNDQPFDLLNLETNTIEKLENALPRSENFLKCLINDYGIQKNYQRQTLRNYFYSMFEIHEYGIDMFTRFSPNIPSYYDFPFRAFFDTNVLFTELNNIAKFLNLDFFPTTELMQLHEDFLKRNQGYQSEIKCTSILKDIWAGRSTDIHLNIIEEAWINWQMASSLRCYDLPILISNTYPTNTLEISQAVFEWKSKDNPIQSQ